MLWSDLMCKRTDMNGGHRIYVWEEMASVAINLDPKREIVKAAYIGTCGNGHTFHADRMSKGRKAGTNFCTRDRTPIVWKSNVPTITNGIDIGDGFTMAVA